MSRMFARVTSGSFMRDSSTTATGKKKAKGATLALTCSWYSIPMLNVLMRMAIIIPRLKYLLSTMRFILSPKSSQYPVSRLRSSSLLWWWECPSLNLALWENSCTTSPSEWEHSESAKSRSMFSKAWAQYGHLRTSKSREVGSTPAICSIKRLWPEEKSLL